MAAQYSDIFNYILGTAPTEQVTAFGNGTMQVDPKYKGIVNLVTDQRGGDDPSSQQRIDIDYSKLPNQGMTKFGKIGVTAMPSADPSTPVGPGQQSTVNDRNLAYYDPNYGWITPIQNQKVGKLDKINSILPYAVMAAATAGAGALAGGAIPLLAKGALAGAKYVGGREGGGVGGGMPIQTALGGADTPQATPQAARGGGFLRSTMTPQTIQLMQLLRSARGG